MRVQVPSLAPCVTNMNGSSYAVHTNRRRGDLRLPAVGFRLKAREWRNGRRTRFRFWRLHGCEGSSPFSRTKQKPRFYEDKSRLFCFVAVERKISLPQLHPIKIVFGVYYLFRWIRPPNRHIRPNLFSERHQRGMKRRCGLSRFLTNM